MSDPQLRCLLCDLILADASTAGQPTERCKQCGRDVLAGQTAAPAGGMIDLQPPVRKEPITVVEELPEATVVMEGSDPAPAEPGHLRGGGSPDDIPVASVAKPAPPPSDVPTVQPRPRPQSGVASAVPPSMARRGTASRPVPPVRKARVPDPSRPAVDRPRPKIVVAFAVLGCMTLLVIVCLAVIAYALLYGLQKARKVEAPRLAPARLLRPGVIPC